MKPVRFGILGLGWPGLQHARAIREVPGVELAAGCDGVEARRKTFLSEFPGTRAFASMDDLLADDGVDAVIVCLPNHLHAPATHSAFAAGKHVLCEKPPTLDVAEMEAILLESHARHLTYAFARQFRFTSDMLDARAFIAAGGLGAPYLARARWLRLRGAPGGVGGWFLDKPRAGGGAIIDLGVHSLDNAWFLCGCPNPVSVSAATGRHFLTEGDVEDTGVAFLRFEGGLVILLEIAWAMNIDAEGCDPLDWAGLESNRTVVHGALAGLQVTPSRVFTAAPDKAPLSIPLPPGPARQDLYETLPGPLPGFARQIEDFANAVRTGAAPTNHATHALELMKMLTGIYESSRTGSEVRFEKGTPPVSTHDLSVLA